MTDPPGSQVASQGSRASLPLRVILNYAQPLVCVTASHRQLVGAHQFEE